jgi:hypothetical protein
MAEPEEDVSESLRRLSIEAERIRRLIIEGSEADQRSGVNKKGQFSADVPGPHSMEHQAPEPFQRPAKPPQKPKP